MGVYHPKDQSKNPAPKQPDKPKKCVEAKGFCANKPDTCPTVKKGIDCSYYNPIGTYWVV